MYRRLARILTLSAAVLALSSPAHAVPTTITVRVISKGAKFIGTSMGGARVTIRDADTGELLATGITEGGTGDTKRIMIDAHVRGDSLSTPDAASYTTVLDLEVPRRLEITATGPLAQRQSTASASATMWVVPGKDVTGGDGFLLQIPGFAVDVLYPRAHVRLKGLPQEVPVEANVTMMCGCPLTPGGLWDADGYEVTALVMRKGKTVATVPLSYAGEASLFRGTWKAEEPGAHEIVVYAYDPATGNTGLDRTTVIVTPGKN